MREQTARERPPDWDSALAQLVFSVLLGLVVLAGSAALALDESLSFFSQGWEAIGYGWIPAGLLLVTFGFISAANVRRLRGRRWWSPVVRAAWVVGSLVATWWAFFAGIAATAD